MGQAREKGKYGYKINNYQAGSIYEYMLGVRTNYDYKKAMLTNSMFLNYMKEHGLQTHNEDSTRDIICIDFSYGSRTYDQEIKHLNSIIKTIEKDNKIKSDYKQERLDKLNYHLQLAHDNKDRYEKKSADQIRTKLYNDGVDIEYYYTNKKGIRVLDEIIHYVMLYRTPGKAKTKKCMFIKEELYDVAREYLYMGIKLPEKNTPVVEIGAYSSLITSTIDINIGESGKIAIAPEQILILKDVDSIFYTNIVSVEIDENKHCYAKDIDNYPVKNTIFDGEAIIDSSIFPKEANGYILLRQHFTKCAAFCSHIQKYFKDYYGDEYEGAYITDMFGRDVRVKDIKLITTDNAIKWIKFDGVTFDHWADWIRKADNYWGIVKTAHKSKFGDVQRMSYQMVNALDINTMPDVCKESLDYIHKLKTDNSVFRQFLIDNSNFSNDYEVLVALVDQDPDFYRSEYFRERKKRIIYNYVLNFKTGKVIQYGDNLVIVQNPFGLLMHAVGEDPLLDPTFEQEEDAIQCWTSRFDDGEYLAEFRSPFNSPNNMGVMHNVYNWRFDEYFDLGELCIAVNTNHTDWQDRNNGSDADSDAVYVTNNPAIVERAKYCYKNYPTIVNNIPKEKNHYDLSLESFALVDNKLGQSQLAIGQSSNLAQVSLSYSYQFTDRKYSDCVVILSVVAQCAIDNCKRAYDIDIVEEINRLRTIMDVDHNKYPRFWLGIRRGFNKRRINEDIQCPMNYLYELKIPKYRDSTSTIPMDQFFVKFDINNNDTRRRSKKIENLIEKYSLKVYKHFQNNDDLDEMEDENYFLIREDFEQLIEELEKTHISKNYKGFMSYLINRAFSIGYGVRGNKNNVNSKTNRNRAILIKVLYSLNPDVFLECFSKNVVK